MKFRVPLLLIIGFLLALRSLAFANPASISSAIDQFVANLSPKANHYFWIVNDSTTPVGGEMVVDINTIVTKKAGEPPDENRFLLLIVEGKLLAAQKIPLNANVDCGNDEEV